MINDSQVSDHGYPRRIHRHQYHALLMIGAGIGIGFSHQDQQLAVGVCGISDPPLSAVNYIMVAVTLDPIAAGNGRGTGAFGWGGAAGTMTWSDPENELVGVLMLQQPSGGEDFAGIVSEAIID